MTVTIKNKYVKPPRPKTRKNRGGPKYTHADYNNDSGMMTTVWGPCTWFFIHTMSFNYPLNPTPKEKKHYREFILNLQNVLPCKHCRNNLKSIFVKFPITTAVMENRESFSTYLYELHNIVNKRLDKPTTMSYADVRDFYENFRARCAAKNKGVNHHAAEKGCTEPLFGKKKAKCILKIVPRNKKCKNITIER